nr:hypothetical protein [Haladaptatus salinisoli]
MPLQHRPRRILGLLVQFVLDGSHERRDPLRPPDELVAVLEAIVEEKQEQEDPESGVETGARDSRRSTGCRAGESVEEPPHQRTDLDFETESTPEQFFERSKRR